MIIGNFIPSFFLTFSEMVLITDKKIKRKQNKN